MSRREWIGRRLPIRTLLLIGLGFLGLAVLGFALIQSRFVMIAVSPLSIAGFYTLAYTAGEFRRRTDASDVP